MAGPGGGANSGGGGRIDTFSFGDLVECSNSLFNTLSDVVDWFSSPLSDHLGDSAVAKAVRRILPDFFNETTGFELIIGSALVAVLGFILLRWLRQTFLI